MIEIFYGIENNYKDITDFVLKNLVKDNVIIIPKNERSRSKLFGDPIPYFLKHIVFYENKNKYILTSNECFHYCLKQNKVLDIPYNISRKIIKDQSIDNELKLQKIHSTVKFLYNSMNGEIPEQKLALKYVDDSCKVLELGGNIGCNSSLLSCIVDNDNIVVIEPDLEIAEKLMINRDLNGFNFKIETSAISERKLIRNGWHTLPEEFKEKNSLSVDTIRFEDLCKKYSIDFDTLIVDCEGAFYYILKDNPNLLINFKLIIVENDYIKKEHKDYVDNVLKNYNFINIESNKLDYSFWPNAPCGDCFYEVWKKNQN